MSARAAAGGSRPAAQPVAKSSMPSLHGLPLREKESDSNETSVFSDVVFSAVQRSPQNRTDEHCWTSAMLVCLGAQRMLSLRTTVLALETAAAFQTVEKRCDSPDPTALKCPFYTTKPPEGGRKHETEEWLQARFRHCADQCFEQTFESINAMSKESGSRGAALGDFVGHTTACMAAMQRALAFLACAGARLDDDDDGSKAASLVQEADRVFGDAYVALAPAGFLQPSDEPSKEPSKVRGGSGALELGTSSGMMAANVPQVVWYYGVMTCVVSLWATLESMVSDGVGNNIGYNGKLAMQFAFQGVSMLMIGQAGPLRRPVANRPNVRVRVENLQINNIVGLLGRGAGVQAPLAGAVNRIARVAGGGGAAAARQADPDKLTALLRMIRADFYDNNVLNWGIVATTYVYQTYVLNSARWYQANLKRHVDTNLADAISTYTRARTRQDPQPFLFAGSWWMMHPPGDGSKMFATNHMHPAVGWGTTYNYTQALQTSDPFDPFQRSFLSATLPNSFYSNSDYDIKQLGKAFADCWTDVRRVPILGVLQHSELNTLMTSNSIDTDALKDVDRATIQERSDVSAFLMCAVGLNLVARGDAGLMDKITLSLKPDTADRDTLYKYANDWLSSDPKKDFRKAAGEAATTIRNVGTRSDSDALEAALLVAISKVDHDVARLLTGNNPPDQVFVPFDTFKFDERRGRSVHDGVHGDELRKLTAHARMEGEASRLSSPDDLVRKLAEEAEWAPWNAVINQSDQENNGLRRVAMRAQLNVLFAMRKPVTTTYSSEGLRTAVIAFLTPLLEAVNLFSVPVDWGVTGLGWIVERYLLHAL